jgi:glutamate/tyrosine decarboxylase-like PLP-dependent enzyme
MNGFPPEALRGLWSEALELALRYRCGIDARSPVPGASAAQLREALGAPLPAQGRDPLEVMRELSSAAGPGLVGTASPAFHGWVMGGSHPVGVAADWLASAWGQNAATYQCSPAAAIAEESAERLLLELLDLPPDASIGFATGATMASFTGLYAARLALFERAGWDFANDGLVGAPTIRVFIGDEAHSTVFHGLRLLGFGARQLVRVPADRQGRMRADALAMALARNPGPAIVIAQAGHINSGSFDPLEAIGEIARRHEAWFHIDGAFGLWARASSRYRHLAQGAELADSCAVDGHKWLQVPFDSGYAILRDRRLHQRAMAIEACYLAGDPADGRNPSAYVPELSRRARGFATWAVIQSLGRDGVASVVERNCANAAELARRLRTEPGVEVLNEVVLNQVCLAPAERSQEKESVDNAIARLAEDGRWFVRGGRWQGRPVLRISFCGAPTEPDRITSLATLLASQFEPALAQAKPVAAAAG